MSLGESGVPLWLGHPRHTEKMSYIFTCFSCCAGRHTAHRFESTSRLAPFCVCKLFKDGFSHQDSKYIPCQFLNIMGSNSCFSKTTAGPSPPRPCVYTHLNASDQQTAKTFALVEALTLATCPLNSRWSSKVYCFCTLASSSCNTSCISFIWGRIHQILRPSLIICKTWTDRGCTFFLPWL